jgi:hypothetical protein
MGYMISRIANAASSMEALSYLFTALVGIGCIGYVTVIWVIHLANTSQYVVAMAVAVGVLLISAAAAVRIPIALFLFFGSAAALGAAFMMGAGKVVLP